MLRRLALLALLVPGIAPSQDLTKPITYKTVAIPIYRALEEISKQAGVRLLASGELEKEPVILVLNGPTTDETMKRIGSTVGAEWKKTGPNEFLLYRSSDLEAKLRKEALEVKAKRIQKGIDRLTTQLLSDEKPFSQRAPVLASSMVNGVKLLVQDKPDGGAYESSRQRLPAARALARLVQMIDPKEIAALREEQRVVYSTRPNKLQLPLPEAADQVGVLLQTEQNLFAEGVRALRFDPSSVWEGRLKKAMAPLSQAPARILLICSGGSMPFVRLLAISDTGEALLTADGQLTPESTDEIMAKRQTTLAKTARDEEIPLSTESRAVAEAYDEGMKSIGNPPPLKPLARKLLLDPVNHDPLSFLPSDAFFELARVRNSNLIAYLPDEAYSINTLLGQDKTFKLDGFLNYLDLFNTDLVEETGWIEAKSRDAIEAWDTRTDRELFGKCLAEGERQGYISIPTAAELAESERCFETPPLTQACWTFGIRYQPYRAGERLILKLYAKLSPTQIESLRRGQPIGAGMLDKEQWERLADVVLTHANALEGPGTEVRADLATYIHSREITEVIPDGIPSDLTFTMKADEAPILFQCIKTDSWDYAFQTTVDELAKFVATQQAGNSADAWHSNPVLWVAPGYARNLTFTFHLTPRHRLRGALREALQGEEHWALDNLPEELRKKLTAAVVNARREIDKSSQETKPVEAAKPPSR